MLKKNFFSTWIICCLGLAPAGSYALTDEDGVVIDDVLGETIQIAANMEHFHGKPTWLLIIRDIDDGINTPYLFDFQQGGNFWLALTFGHDYIITASQLTIIYYKPAYNAYRKYVINDFCHLQSSGKIHRGTSMSITLNGRLSLNRNLYNCSVTTYPGDNFTIVEPELE